MYCSSLLAQRIHAVSNTCISCDQPKGVSLHIEGVLQTSCFLLYIYFPVGPVSSKICTNSYHQRRDLQGTFVGTQFSLLLRTNQRRKYHPDQWSKAAFVFIAECDERETKEAGAPPKLWVIESYIDLDQTRALVSEGLQQKSIHLSKHVLFLRARLKTW